MRLSKSFAMPPGVRISGGILDKKLFRINMWSLSRDMGTLFSDSDVDIRGYHYADVNLCICSVVDIGEPEGFSL